MTKLVFDVIIKATRIRNEIFNSNYNFDYLLPVRWNNDEAIQQQKGRDFKDDDGFRKVDGVRMARI